MGDDLLFSNNAVPSIPQKQDFLWCAEYVDGSHLLEYDFEKSNDFNDIRKQELLRFGLIGTQAKLYFEVFGGIFKINGQMIQLSYIDGEDRYDLMGQPIMHSDIITFKDADFLFDPRIAGSGKSTITQYNFGYKAQLNINGVHFGFQAICQLPMNQKARMEFKIVADKDMNGHLEIKRNNYIVTDLKAPLSKQVGGEITWEIQ